MIYIVEIHHSGWKPSICDCFFDALFFASSGNMMRMIEIINGFKEEQSKPAAPASTGNKLQVWLFFCFLSDAGKNDF